MSWWLIRVLRLEHVDLFNCGGIVPSSLMDVILVKSFIAALKLAAKMMSPIVKCIKCNTAAVAIGTGAAAVGELQCRSGKDQRH